MKFDIKRRWDQAVLYSGDGETICEIVVRAAKSGADLRGADLRGADLRGAYLRGAYLRGADLRGAYLRGADLGDADLGGADLRGADLRDADLGGAHLRGAYLRGADLGGVYLRGAYLRGADLGASAVMLASGSWGELSDNLTADLMLWDAANHPHPEMFDAWAEGGPCPYGDGKVQRACQFMEKRHLWGKGEVCRPWDLWERLRAEKCPNWTDDEVAAFEAKFKEKR